MDRTQTGWGEMTEEQANHSDEAAELHRQLAELRAGVDERMRREHGEGPPAVSKFGRQVEWWNAHSRLLWLTTRGPMFLLASSIPALFLSGRYPLLAWVWGVSILAGIAGMVISLQTNAFSAIHEPRYTGLGTSERLELMASRIRDTRDDLASTLSEIDRLRELAAHLEQEAEDNLELSQMTSAQLEAWERRSRSEHRRNLRRDVLFFVAGMALNTVIAVLVT